MKVAVKIYEVADGGHLIQDVVVNNRYVIPFNGPSVECIVQSLKEKGVTDWAKLKLGSNGCFEHKLTNLVWHGDIEVTE